MANNSSLSERYKIPRKRIGYTILNEPFTGLPMICGGFEG